MTELPLTLSTAWPSAGVATGVGSCAPLRNAMKRSGSGGMEVSPTSSLQLPTASTAASVSVPNTRRFRMTCLLWCERARTPERSRHTPPTELVKPALAVESITATRRPVPKTRKPRPRPVEASVLRPPCQRCRPRPERAIDVAQRHLRRDRPAAPLRRGDADRGHLAVGPEVDHRRGGVVRTLIHLDDEGPGALRRPHPLEREHAGAGGLVELELEGAALAVHDPFCR